ncbi:hypothetical protein C8R43DRAFT_1134331 [Mycena crocata]|nr:hypothetical protein C8R43DRAFT_1134331 [Mycena crocata]
MPLASMTFPCLKRLELRVAEGDKMIVDVFATSTPNLREFIAVDWWEKRSPSIRLPWEQLHLYRGSHFAEEQLQILVASPNLVECSLRVYDLRAVEGSDPLTLPCLRRLNLHESEILPHLTAPLLEYLVLYDYSYPVGDLEPLRSFIHRSSCQLQILVLAVGDDARSSDLIDVLRALPSLTYLFLQGPLESGGPTAVLNSMTMTGTCSDLCPNLTSFIYGLYARPNDLLTRGPLTTMISSRLAPYPSSRLKFLRFHNSGGSRNRVPDAQLKSWEDQSLDAACVQEAFQLLLYVNPR